MKVIAFDADDTLWHNESYFREAEDKFCELMEDYMPQHSVNRELLKTEIGNLTLYGYGIKSFMLSMIETALNISEHKIDPKIISECLNIGRDLLEKPVVLLPNVEETLIQLKRKYRLIVATKGDLLDQERKLKKSGLLNHFHHIEIMSEKKEADYHKLITHLDIKPHEFTMIGNSLKSDVLPVLKLGGVAIHIPYHITWEHEKAEIDLNNKRFKQADNITELLDFL